MSKVGPKELADLYLHYGLDKDIVKSRAAFLGVFNVIDPSKLKKHKLTDNIEKAEEIKSYDSRIYELNQWIEDYRYKALNVNTVQDNRFKPYRLFVPLSKYLVIGKSDAIIRTEKESSPIQIGPHVVALIDFKTEDTVNKSLDQGIFELIGRLT